MCRTALNHCALGSSTFRDFEQRGQVVKKGGTAQKKASYCRARLEFLLFAIPMDAAVHGYGLFVACIRGVHSPRSSTTIYSILSHIYRHVPVRPGLAAVVIVGQFHLLVDDLMGLGAPVSRLSFVETSRSRYTRAARGMRRLAARCDWSRNGVSSLIKNPELEGMYLSSEALYKASMIDGLG